jgi:hypothetical protein
MTRRVTDEIGTDPTRQWFGIYEGRIIHIRESDLYIQAKVPQVLGQAVTNWAAPMIDPRQGTQYSLYGIPPAPDYPPGPGPGIGSRVLVMFVGGDINTPVYCLYGI